MADNRGDTLLAEAANQLDAGYVVPSGDFLQNNSVTLSEALSLTDTLAALIRGYLRLDPALRAMVLLLGADTEQKIPEWIAVDDAFYLRTMRRMKSGDDQEENFFPKKEG